MGQRLFTASRVGLGGIFFIFGLNGFFHFVPLDPPPAEATFFAADYLFPFVKVVETTCGALFLANRFVPLATAIIAPVTTNILLFHLFLDLAGLPIALALITMNAALAYAHKEAFIPMLQAKAQPKR